MSKLIDGSRRTFLKVVGVVAGAASVPMATDAKRKTRNGDDDGGEAAWPNPQYDPAHTSYNPTATGPKHGVEATNVVNLDEGESVNRIGGVVAGDGAIFYFVDVNLGDENEHEYRLYAWDYTDRSVRWQRTGEYNPLVVEDEVVYTGRQGSSGNGIAQAFSTDDGSERWTEEYDNTGNPIGAVIDRGTVYASFGYDAAPAKDAGLYAIDATCGAVKWNVRKDLRRKSLSAATVADDTVYLTVEEGGFYAFDKRTGNERWTFDDGVKGVFGTMTPAAADSTVIVGDEKRYLFALDAETGRERWRFENGAVDGWSSVAVANGTVYLGDVTGDSVRKDGQFYALNLTDGSVKWSRTDETVYEWIGPAVTDGVVYVGTDYNKVYAFDAEAGETRWLHDRGHHRVWETSAIVDGKLYVQSDDDKSARVEPGLYELREA